MSLLFRQSTTCAALACAGFLLGASLYASILPPDRTGGPTPAWARANVGVEGGIPNSSNMTVYATVPAGASSSTIQAALNACPSNQVVQLSAGNYPNLSGIRIPNGVVLRGAGMTSTVLTFTSGGIGAGGSDFAHLLRVGTYGAPPGYGIANWTAGYAQGGSNLTFSTTSGLSVGNIVYLDQINDPFYVSYAGYEGPRIGGRDQNHEQMQMCEVQNVNGNTVTVWPPIAMPNWSGALSPAASWMAGSSWVRKAGVENLTIDGSVSGGIGANQGNIAFSSARDCWVQNVKSLNGYRCHIAFEYGGFRNEARHCYFYGTQHAAQESYGIITIVCSSCLVEDNIFEKVASPILPQDCSSMNVSAYNYTTNNYYTGGSGYLMASIDDHANHICMNLNEGNYGNGFAGDFIWGSGSHNVAFRNRYTGWEPYQY